MIFFSIACSVIVISLVYITVLKVKATCDPIIYPLSQFNHQFPAEQVQVMLDISKKCSSYSIQKKLSRDLDKHKSIRPYYQILLGVIL
jgi:hypothetical protein